MIPPMQGGGVDLQAWLYTLFVLFLLYPFSQIGRDVYQIYTSRLQTKQICHYSALKLGHQSIFLRDKSPTVTHTWALIKL